MHGYLGRILRVDLSRGSLWDEALDEDDARHYVGGSGLAARYLYDVLDSDTDPLGPDNPQPFLTGPLVGTSMTSAGRYSVCARSPLTGIWGEANSGGFFGPQMRCAGYDGVWITGAAADPVWLSIVDGKTALHDARELWGSDIHITQARLRKSLGEAKGRVACIANDHGRFAGRTGLGAVMGSKNLKAIAVRGTGKVPLYAPDEFRTITNQVLALYKDETPSESLRAFGTSGYVNPAHMLGSERTDDPVCGTVSSGGTESILLAMKTYRDWARATKGITAPEIIAPVTSHAAFDKAAQYFGLRLVRTPLDGDYAADVAAVEAAITPNTVAVIGSAPSFPHGVVDPIEALSELARARGIGFHTDGCLGGFLLPWAERLGFPVPAFDFRLPGVTSISADTHKFGYAAKGSSVVLYRTPDLRRYQYYATADWPGGLYFSPTFAGSRPGALSAVCWAAMMSIGEQGYLQAAKRILGTTAWLREGVAGIPGLHLIGRSLFIVAFASHEVDVYPVLDALAKKQWNLNGLQNPASLHLCITQRHTQPGVAEAFIADLQAAVEHVRRNPQDKGTMGAVYGLAGSVPVKSLVADFLKTYIDLMYRVD